VQIAPIRGPTGGLTLAGVHAISAIIIIVVVSFLLSAFAVFGIWRPLVLPVVVLADAVARLGGARTGTGDEGGGGRHGSGGGSGGGGGWRRRRGGGREGEGGSTSPRHRRSRSLDKEDALALLLTRRASQSTLERVASDVPQATALDGCVLSSTLATRRFFIHAARACEAAVTWLCGSSSSTAAAAHAAGPVADARCGCLTRRCRRARGGAVAPAYARASGSSAARAEAAAAREARDARRQTLRLPGLLETEMLRGSILRIWKLVQLGFGDAGQGIISRYISPAGDVRGDVAKGEKVHAIFGFCDIRSFTELTEALQEDVLPFVNDVASLVHTEVVASGGAPNKNIGDAFLLVWKFPSKPLENRVAAVHATRRRSAVGPDAAAALQAAVGGREGGAGGAGGAGGSRAPRGAQTPTSGANHRASFVAGLFRSFQAPSSGGESGGHGGASSGAAAAAGGGSESGGAAGAGPNRMFSSLRMSRPRGLVSFAGQHSSSTNSLTNGAAGEHAGGRGGAGGAATNEEAAGVGMPRDDSSEGDGLSGGSWLSSLPSAVGSGGAGGGGGVGSAPTSAPSFLSRISSAARRLSVRMGSGAGASMASYSRSRARETDASF
jgi:hypothetical protein